MNLISYVKKFGAYSFEEKPFNDVDAAILCTAVYSNLEVVAPSIFDTISHPSTFGGIKEFDMDIVTAGRILLSQNKKLIPLLSNSKRFRDVSITYINKILNSDVDNQFYACTFLIPNVGAFVAFRGTDSSIIGWKENFNFGYRKVVISQLDAVEYLRIVSEKVKGPFYVGGHSKGGNLTLYSCLNCDKKIRDRIIKAYSFDGNGLTTNDYLTSDEFVDLKKRYVFIRPYKSYVGQTMYIPESNYIVKSRSFGLFQHNTYFWKIDKQTGEFMRAKSLTKKSELWHITLFLLIEKMDKDEIKLTIDFFDKVFGGPNRTIFSVGKIHRFFRTLRQYSKEDRGKINHCRKALKEARKEAKAQLKAKNNHK